MYGDITRITLRSFDPGKFAWVEGREFEWEDIFKIKYGTFANMDKYTVPSLYNQFELIALYIVLLSFLTFYFDIVLSSNRGQGESPFFFLKPAFWIRSFRSNYVMPQSPRKRRRSSFNDGAGSEEFADTAVAEKRYVREMEEKQEKI